MSSQSSSSAVTISEFVIGSTEIDSVRSVRIRSRSTRFSTSETALASAFSSVIVRISSRSTVITWSSSAISSSAIGSTNFGASMITRFSRLSGVNASRSATLRPRVSRTCETSSRCSWFAMYSASAFLIWMNFRVGVRSSVSSLNVLTSFSISSNMSVGALTTSVSVICSAWKLASSRSGRRGRLRNVSRSVRDSAFTSSPASL